MLLPHDSQEQGRFLRKGDPFQIPPSLLSHWLTSSSEANLLVNTIPNNVNILLIHKSIRSEPSWSNHVPKALPLKIALWTKPSKHQPSEDISQTSGVKMVCKQPTTHFSLPDTPQDPFCLVQSSLHLLLYSFDVLGSSYGTSLPFKWCACYLLV
jgi:hypothetical protein